MYEKMIEHIPETLQIDHICNNRECVNPFHMMIVPQRQNILRGSSMAAIYADRKCCKNGHPLIEENIYYWNKSRICKICYKAKRHKFYFEKGKFCPSGHEKIGDNLLIGKDGHRYCKICMNINMQNLGGG